MSQVDSTTKAIRTNTKIFIKEAVQKRHLKIAQQTAMASPNAQISPKRKLSETKATEVIELSSDDETSTSPPQCKTPNPKRARVFSPQATPPSQNAELVSNTEITHMSPPRPPPAIHANETVFISPQTPTNPTSQSASSPNDSVLAATAETLTAPQPTLPTPTTTPIKNPALQALPELADRYLAKTSTAEGIEYTGPMKFTLKPAFWKKWEGRQYVALAGYLRAQFDPVPFAKETGLPVEEVKQVVNALVCNPLYFADEAKKRGDEGMQALFELFNKYGTTSRPWGKAYGEKKRVLGELYRVEVGVVEVILSSGSKIALKLTDLSDGDVQYLTETLTEEDKASLWRPVSLSP